MIISEHDYLEHFGVKGMKWGVRRAPKKGSQDVVLKKGEKVFNISAREARNIKGQVYTAHKLKDVLNYRSTYASNQSYDNVPVFSNAFTVTKGVKAAGRDVQVKAFKEMWDKDPSGMAKSLADVKKDMKFAAAFNARILKLDRDDVYQKRLVKKGERWVKGRGLNDFNASLAVTTEAVRSNTSKLDKNRTIDDTYKKLYFDTLAKRGYNAIVDLNDTRNYGSEEPLLIFKGDKTLKRSGLAVKLTEKDMQKAEEAYLDAKKLRDFQDILHRTAPTKRSTKPTPERNR